MRQFAMHNAHNAHLQLARRMFLLYSFRFTGQITGTNCTTRKTELYLVTSNKRDIIIKQTHFIKDKITKADLA